MRFELVESQEHPELSRYRYWHAHRDASPEAVKKAKTWAAKYGKAYRSEALANLRAMGYYCDYSPRTFAWSEDSQDMFPRPAAYKRKKV